MKIELKDIETGEEILFTSKEELENYILGLNGTSEKKNKSNSSRKKANGEGSLYYSETLQKWVGQYYTKEGKRKTITQRKNEKATDFKKKFNAILASIDNGTYIERNTKSLYAILNDYIENKYKIGITKGRTYLRDNNTLNLLKDICRDFINKPIQNVTVNDIRMSLPNFMEVEKQDKNGNTYTFYYSQNTINKLWIFLNKGFKIAVADRIIVYNPMNNENLNKPKSKAINKKVEALTVDEHKKLIDILLNKSTNDKYTDIILLQLYTGMRIGEVLALSRENINLKEGTITVNRTLTRDSNDKVIMGSTAKTDAGVRTFYISPSASALCSKILKSNISNIENLIFWDYDKNSYITPSQVNCYLHRLNKIYKITDHIHTHMLRHTFATRFIEAGGSAKVLQSILGHNKIDVTLNTYTSVLDKFSKQEVKKVVNYMSQFGIA